MIRLIFEPDRGQRVPIRVWARAISPETVRHMLERARREGRREHAIGNGNTSAPMRGLARRDRAHESANEVLERSSIVRARVGGDAYRGHSAAEIATESVWHHRVLGRENRADRHAFREMRVRHRRDEIDVRLARELLQLSSIATRTERCGSSFTRVRVVSVLRCALVARALDVVANVLDVPLDPSHHVDIHHNFVTRERWHERDLLVHRKGAIAVPQGALALIPGSMGTASYVVEGLGNEASFGSCSHGAGRVLSRKEARKSIRPELLAEAMRRVVFPEALARHIVEEAPAAYRDIVEVLADQEDLVRRRTRLEPMAVLKG